MKAPRVGAFLFRWLKAAQTDYLRKIPFLFDLDIKKKKSRPIIYGGNG
jgi:hypothetical protein